MESEIHNLDMFSFVDILKKNIMSAEYKHFRRKIHKSCVGKKTRILGYKFLPFHSGRILFNACPVESKHKLNLWRRPTKNEEQNYKMHAENVDVRVRPPTLVFFCLTRTNSGLGLYWTDVQCTKINLDWKGSKFSQMY